ncbi:MAG: inovirus Gp2 family protein [Pseudomonas sp.]|nr:inovirus Gp2 family protein [Pseudomonas sp.]
MKKDKSKDPKEITFEPTFKGFEINTGKYKHLGVYVDILEPMLEQIQALLTHHSRIQLLKFDLHLPVTNQMTAKAGNQVISKFFKLIKQDLARAKWNRQKKVIHCWAREVGDSINGHYHCYIGVSSTVALGTFYNGAPTKVWKLIHDRWKSVSGGSVWPSNPYVVNRGKHKELNTAFKHLSYICKVRSKDFGTGEDHKRYFNSKLKPKEVADQHPAFDIAQCGKGISIEEYPNQLSNSTSDSKWLPAKLVPIDDDAVAGNDAPYKRSVHIGYINKKMADQLLITDCHPGSLEQFFVSTTKSGVVMSMQT